MIVPIWGDKLQLQGNVLYGQGIGRYDAAQLPDFTVRRRWDRGPLTGFSLMGGMTSHNAIKDLDLYAYAGENHVFNHVVESANRVWRRPYKQFSGCLAITSRSNTTCAAEINDVWQVTGGFWHSLYDGNKGKVVWGLQDSFTVDTTPLPVAASKSDLTGKSAINERGHDVVPLLSQIWAI